MKEMPPDKKKENDMIFRNMLVVETEIMGWFNKVLSKAYAVRGDSYTAISHAIWKVTGEDRCPLYYPQLAVVGNVCLPEGADFVQEVFLGRFVKVEPDAVIFFPGEDLADDEKRKSFCGIATFGSDILGKTLIGVICHNLMAGCYIHEIKGVKYFYWRWGMNRDPEHGRFQISEEMFEKIKKFFNK